MVPFFYVTYATPGTWHSGRVTQGGCPPRVPTDPDLPNYVPAIGSPTPLCQVSGFPGLELLWGFRRPGARAL